MYAYINYLKRSSIGAGVGAVIGAVGASGVEMRESASEGVELLERVDLLEPLADRLRLSAASLLATLWAAAPLKGVRRRDEAIGAKGETR